MVDKKKRGIIQTIFIYRYLFIMLIPGLLYFVLFKYLPMFGLVISFKDYDIFKGVWESPWVGIQNFKAVFSSKDFWSVLRNTLIISFYKIIVGFPIPIILALLLNEIRSISFRRVTQTVLYLPHFISWVVLGGIMLNILSPNYGIVNQIIEAFGGEKINLLISRPHFRGILVISDVWKSSGWGTIIYLATLTQIDPTLYDVSAIDGAGRWKQTLHITLPSMYDVIVLLLILRMGRILNVGFEQILVLQNPVVRDISDVFETYVYREGLGRGNYSFSATVDFFKAVVAAALIISANTLSKKMGQDGLM